MNDVGPEDGLPTNDGQPPTAGTEDALAETMWIPPNSACYDWEADVGWSWRDEQDWAGLQIGDQSFGYDGTMFDDGHDPFDW